jgi:plasmid stabilization system protein ParE
VTGPLPIRVVRRAAREIAQISKWWDENRPAALGAIGEELGKAFELIASSPQVGSRATNSNLRGVRRVHLSRIRYHLYYRVRTQPACVEVLALWHTSRGSAPPL